MHNGAIASFDKIKKKLIADLTDESFRFIQGTTDTEHAGALFIQFLPQGNPNNDKLTVDDMKTAMTKTIRHVLELTKVGTNIN
jgi:glutamine amidotransferase